MRRRTCRHMFHRICLVAAAEAAPKQVNQVLAIKFPNCRGHGHAIACWNYTDTSITTQFDPRTVSEAPNLLETAAPRTPRTLPRVPGKPSG